MNKLAGWCIDLGWCAVVIAIIIGGITFVQGGFHPYTWEAADRVFLYGLLVFVSLGILAFRRDWFDY